MYVCHSKLCIAAPVQHLKNFHYYVRLKTKNRYQIFFYWSQTFRLARGHAFEVGAMHNCRWDRVAWDDTVWAINASLGSWRWYRVARDNMFEVGTINAWLWSEVVEGYEP